MGSILASLSGLRICVAMSCGVGCRLGSDLALLWLWRRPAATAPIRPLAWEPAYAVGVALTRPKKKKSGRTKYRRIFHILRMKTTFLREQSRNQKEKDK